jgi:hypothetical protein
VSTRQTPVGIEEDHEYEIYDEEHTIFFGVTVRTLPPALSSKTRTFLNAFTRALLRNKSYGENGKVERVRDISLNGTPGKEIIVTKKDGRASMKGKICLYIIRDKTFELTALEPAFRYPSVTSEKFFQSFQLYQAP